MKYELSGKQKKLEFDLFFEAINSNKLQYYSEYGQDFDFDDKITKTVDEDNWYNGEKKFELILNNIIKKLDLLGMKYIINKSVKKEKYESGFREYEIPHYSYDFLMTDPKFSYKFADLTYEERSFCSLELVFLMMMHNMKVNLMVLSNIFGTSIDRQTFSNIRANIKEVLNFKIEKNHKGRYKLIKEKYEL